MKNSGSKRPRSPHKKKGKSKSQTPPKSKKSTRSPKSKHKGKGKSKSHSHSKSRNKSPKKSGRPRPVTVNVMQPQSPKKDKSPYKSKHNRSKSPKPKSKSKGKSPNAKSPRKNQSKSPKKKSPKKNRSKLNSPKKNRSKSPKKKSPMKNRSKLNSPKKNRSKSPKKKSPMKNRSKLNSPMKNRSKSPKKKSPKKNRSKLNSPMKNRSKSPKKKSPNKNRSKSNSPKKSPKNKSPNKKHKGKHHRSKKSKSKSPSAKNKRSKHRKPIHSSSSSAADFRRPPSEASEPSKSTEKLPPSDQTSGKESNEPNANEDIPQEGQAAATAANNSPPFPASVEPEPDKNRKTSQSKSPRVSIIKEEYEPLPVGERRRYGSVDDSKQNDILNPIPTSARGIPGASGYYQNPDRRQSGGRKSSQPPTVGEVVEQTRRGSQPPPNDHGYRRRSSFDKSKRNSKGGVDGTGTGDDVFEVTVYEKKKALLPAFREQNAHLITPHTLYKEALYTSVHYLGMPSVRYPSTKEDLCFYSHVVFKVDPKDQVAAMEHVVGEAFPLTVINTKVRRAEGVEARDNNQLPDTYCVVAVDTLESSNDFQVDKPEWESLTAATPLRSRAKGQNRSSPEKRMKQFYERLPPHIKTSVQLQTNKPVWDQRFQCLALRPSIDILTIELWDDESETGGTSKSKRRGSHKKNRDIFIGKVSVPVQNIPCEGEAKWHFIQGTTHRKKAAVGRLLLEVWLTHAYRHGKNYEEYGEARVVLEMLWDYILHFESSRYSGEWNGDIPPAAICLLFQYALQTGISEASQAIIRWNAYAKYNLGLFAVQRRLTELGNALEKARDWKDVRECDLEANMTVIAVEKILPVIRNHLNETQERVREAVKAIKHCQDILSKFPCKRSGKDGMFRVQFLVEAEIRMAALEWYQTKHLEYFGNFGTRQISCRSADAVECLARLLNEVNSLMRDCLHKWKPLFWLDGMIDYMPLVYDEFQKMVIHDVETMCWHALNYYDTNTKLRKVLLNLDSGTRRLCRALFDLYVQTQVFVLDQDVVFDEHYCQNKSHGRKERYYQMNRYHRWFRPALVLWLGYALIKAADMISMSIQIDNVTVDNEKMMTSSSASDAGLVYSQLAAFWKQLNWPDIAEGYVILHYLFEVMCFVTIMYARLKRSKLEQEGYFDTVDRFDISQRLCTALNNIEFVKESLIKIPDDTKMDSILMDLDQAVGDGYARTHRVRISNLLTGTLVHIEVQFKKILHGVAERVRPEIRERFQQCFFYLQEANTTDDDTLVPVLTYLEDNIVILYKSLLELNFVRVLQMFWNVTCQEILHHLRIYTRHQSEEKKKKAHENDPFFQRIRNIITILIAYFEGGGGGLNDTEIETKHYKALNLFLSCLSLPTNLLIATYYREAAEEQMEIKEPSKLGTLTVRVSYYKGQLNVEVISAKNLSVRDEPLPWMHWCRKQEESSDPQVEVSLMPPQNFQDVKARSHKTDVKWKSQHPVFNEKFKWQLAEEVCMKLDSVLVFTVRDFDHVSRDDFLGQAIVPIAQMPGLMKYNPVAQPMHLQLRSVDVKRNPIISILYNRTWDSQAQAFANEQEKYVIVIKDLSQGAPLRLGREKN